MPPKKPTGGQKVNPPAPPEVLSIAEGGDPVLVAISIIDKKARNLEKRKNKLTTLKNDSETGTSLDKDQLAAVAKLDEVCLQLELIRELQKQFTSLHTEHQKNLKKKQKVERQQARDAERKLVAYTLRVQDILNSMGETDKENLKTGTNGAVLLTDAELSQLDQLYTILTPTRQGNPNYQTEVNNSSELIQLLLEQSTKEVLDTTYKQLYDVINRLDQSDYFDRPASDNDEEEEDSQEEEAADDEDYKSAEDNMAAATEIDDSNVENNEENVENVCSVESVDNAFIPSADVGRTLPDLITSQQSQTPVVQSDLLSEFVPPVPSPTFPGLGLSPLKPVSDDGFSFIHESEVDKSSIINVQQQITSSLENTPITTPPDNQYSSSQGGDLNIQKLSIMTPEGNIIPHPATNTVPVSTIDQSVTQSNDNLAATDVATGQSTSETPYQEGVVTMVSANGSLMSSAPPSNAYSQQLQQGNVYAGGPISDENSGYQNPYGAPLRMGGQQNRNSRGNRRGGGGPGPKGGVYRNGRGMQGNYDMQGVPYGSSRGYSGGGGNYQRNERGGGRPNYRTTGGGVAGPRK